MRLPQSILQKLAVTAMQKHAAAKARNMPDREAEKPRAVILAASEAIANRLRDKGFSYQKSGPSLKRAQGDLGFRIMFQSDRNNIAGVRAAVWIHAGVYSKKLSAWRNQYPMPWGGSIGPGAGAVAGGQIGNLTSQCDWMEWDFADGETRHQEIESALRAIQQIILPFFEQFIDPAAAVDACLRRPALRQSSLLEYALVELGRDAAEAAGRAYLEDNPAVAQEYRTALVEIEHNGLPRFIGHIGREMAAIAFANELNLTGD